MEDIERNLIIIALDNLINTYSIALEDKETTEEDKEFFQTAISIAYNIINKYNKPQWDQL